MRRRARAIANSGAATGPGRRDRLRQSDRARTGHRRTAMRSNAAITGSTARQARPGAARQNDRFVTVLKVTESRRQAGAAAPRGPAACWVRDRQSATRRQRHGRGASWLKRDVEPAHTEYRDDRFVAAFDRKPDQPAFFTRCLYRSRRLAGALRASAAQSRTCIGPSASGARPRASSKSSARP